MDFQLQGRRAKYITVHNSSGVERCCKGLLLLRRDVVGYKVGPENEIAPFDRFWEIMELTHRGFATSAGDLPIA